MIDGIPDWRDIGRHIGKRLRDVLRPGQDDDGPSSEERLERRKQDILKGFAYFDTFDEIKEWHPETVDPLQQANTPLLPRAAFPVFNTSGTRSRILVCHDYKGGYIDSESARPEMVRDEPYSCGYLQFVETWCYFAHKLVSTPPASWINCLHRNNVKALGTFITESQTPAVDRLFEEVDGRYIVADQLVKMSKTFGFDGWLLNLEKAFHDNRTEQLIRFMHQLKLGLGEDAIVIWYDSLTIHNDVRYQNSLSPENICFAEAADGLFTNYKWTPDKLQQSASLALESNLPLSKIYFGIDVWAQNNNDVTGPRRITWPKEGGGGSNTGLAVKLLAEHGYSAAIFAPGWTHEHFAAGTSNNTRYMDREIDSRVLCDKARILHSQPLALGSSEAQTLSECTEDTDSMTASTTILGQSIQRSVGESIWEGAVLPTRLDCDCKGRPHHMSQYQKNPIAKSAVEFPVGSESFFETDFGAAWYLVYSDPLGPPKVMPCLGMQSPEPHILPLASQIAGEPTNPSAAGSLYYCFISNRTGTSAKRALSIRTQEVALAFEARPRGMSSLQKLCLYNLSVLASTSLLLKTTCSRRDESLGSVKDFGLYVGFLDGSERLEYELFSLPDSVARSQELQFEIKERSKGTRLVELGVFCQGLPSLRDEELFQCHCLCIIPQLAVEAQARLDFSICDLKLIERGVSPHVQKRLAWKWKGDRAGWPLSLPFSPLSGPFSHFSISINGQEVGVSHSLEFPLKSDEVDSLEVHDGVLSFMVRGIYFGGLKLRRPTVASITICSAREAPHNGTPGKLAMLSPTRRLPSLLTRVSLRFASGTTHESDKVPTNDPKPPKEVPNVSASNALPLSTQGIKSGTLQETVEEGEAQRQTQAPNRKSVWSRSQQPRDKAMSGPRFEQTIMELQPQPYAAIDLIHKQPVRWTDEKVVACDGGGGPLGHPRIFINLDKPQINFCTYCGLPFANNHHRKHLQSLPSTTYPLVPENDPAEVEEPQRVSDEPFAQR